MATSHNPGEDTKVIDPVCGMTVNPARAAGHTDYKGQTYYFCGLGCLKKFTADPEKFLTTSPDAPVGRALSGSTYTCPMHPEVVRDGPGSCPICGMALEPVAVTLDEQPNEELHDMTRRFWVCVVLTLPLLAIGMGAPVPSWVQLALATPVVLWGGWPFFARGWASILSRHLNMFTLIAMGVGAAYGYSVAATLAPGLFPDSFRMAGEVAVYFEPAAVIVVLVLLGQVLELRARSRTSDAIPQPAQAGAKDGAARE